MLQNLLEKINMNGLYYHKPERKYSRHDYLYWCQNWTFKPYVYKELKYTPFYDIIREKEE